jgi:2,4-diaminopentanoate dehydrogenase
MTYRVIQWSTGNVGRLALRAIIEHPELELVGLVVNSDAKAGQDAAALCGLDTPTGVVATTDTDAALALDADCVSYTATGDLRPHEAVLDMCRALEAGKNVVSTSVVSLVHPGSADKGAVERLRAACERGGTSFFTSGIDPGFANDLMPLTLFGFCSRVDRARVMEILDYSTYMQPEVIFDTMGFGQPLDSTPLILLPGVLTLAWGGVVHLMADGLGVQLDEIREVHERVEAHDTFTTPVGTIEKGTVAGLRFEVQGIVGGEPRLIVEHVTRMHPDVAPEWPQGQGYRISIEGDPSYTCELTMKAANGDHNDGGLLATAMRVLNAIPAVCAAHPGLLTPLDLPLITGKGSMRV